LIDNEWQWSELRREMLVVLVCRRLKVEPQDHDPSTLQLLYTMMPLSVHRQVTNVKSFPNHVGPQGGADFCFHNPQPDTSLCRETTDTALVHRVVFLFTCQLLLLPSYTAQ